jgi:hypothetical protein
MTEETRRSRTASGPGPVPGGHHPRRVPGLGQAIAALMIVLVGAVAGCSSGGIPVARPSSHDTGSAKPGASAAAMPTGTQLGQAIGSVRLPTGWTHAQGTGGGQVNSGSMITPPNGVPPSQDSCSVLDSNVSSMAVLAWWSSSYDSMVLTYPSIPANLPQLNVSAGLYKPGYAAKTMAFLTTLIGHCHSFGDKFLSNDPVTVSVTTVPHLGQQNLFLTSVEHTSAGVITARMILVEDGNVIVGSDTNTATDGDVRPATLQGFAYWMLQVLQSKSLL